MDIKRIGGTKWRCEIKGQSEEGVRERERERKWEAEIGRWDEVDCDSDRNWGSSLLYHLSKAKADKIWTAAC